MKNIFNSIKNMTRRIIDILNIIISKACEVKGYWFFIQSLNTDYPIKSNYIHPMKYYQSNYFGLMYSKRINYGYY